MGTGFPLPVDAALILVGATLQGYGFWLALTEVRAIEARLEAFREAARHVFAHAGAARGSGTARAAGTRNAEPTLEERVVALEASQAHHAQEEEEAHGALRRYADERIAEAIESLSARFEPRLGRLEKLTQELASGAIRPRLRGVVAFVVGLGLMAVGSVDAIV